MGLSQKIRSFCKQSEMLEENPIFVHLVNVGISIACCFNRDGSELFRSSLHVVLIEMEVSWKRDGSEMVVRRK